MKVLVTGGTGFVGPRVVRALSRAGHEVRVLERRAGTAARLALPAADTVTADVTDPPSLRAAVAGCDAVVHLVAIINGSREDFERVMVRGTADLVGAAAAEGVRRFVLMSALGVDERTRGLTPYYAAKWEMERLVEGSGLEHVIFRPSFVFGPDGGVLPTFLRVARLAPVTPVIGSGERRFQPIWVEDVGAYFAASVDHPAAAGRAFELGGPDVVSWNEFWRRAKRAAGARRRPSLHVPVALMRVQAALLERLPNPLVTRDQLTMLEAGDNVVTSTDAVATFGLPLVPLDEQLRRAAART